MAITIVMAMILPGEAGAKTLEQKVGQMIMVGITGFKVADDNPVVRDIVDYGIGGVVLLEDEAWPKETEKSSDSSAWLREMTASLRNLPGGDRLLIAVSHEGGEFTTLKEGLGFNRSLAQGYLGENDNISLTMKSALDSAQYISDLGFNLNLAPLVNLGPAQSKNELHFQDRFFSQDPDVVLNHAWEVINAYRVFRVLTAVKYFPGIPEEPHGSYKGFPDISKSWDDRELSVFQELIQDPGCDLVMIGHYYNTHLDPEWPASLSERTINGVLRQKLGFDKVVISDDMLSQAMQDNYSLDKILERAVLAGVDMIMFGKSLVHEPDIAKRSIQTIVNLVDQGRISKSRIDESYERIAELKSRLRPPVESDCSFCLE